jgi:hypothetical protein
MSLDTTNLFHQIGIIIQKGHVYLHNQSDEMIEALTYETVAMLTMEDVIAVSAAPKYLIHEIPPQTAVLLEVLDGWEDGKPYYYLTKLKSQSVDFQGNILLKIKHFSGILALPQIKNCAVVKLETKDGFTINMNNNG